VADGTPGFGLERQLFAIPQIEERLFLPRLMTVQVKQ